MRYLRFGCLTVVLSWLMASAVTADDPPAKEADSPAETVRKALDKTVTLDFSSQNMQEVVQHLKEKTNINFVIDLITIQQMGVLIDENGNPMTIHLKIEKGKLRQGLQRILQPYSLSCFIVGDSVLISTEETGVQRQMRQRIDVDVNQVPLETALRKLARTHAISLLIDPKVLKDAKTPVTLQLDDVTLETTVRLLAELGGLKSVRLGNVLFITDEGKATKLRQEEKDNNDLPDGRLPKGYAVPALGAMAGRALGVPIPPPPAAPPANVAPARPAAPPAPENPPAAGNNAVPAPSAPRPLPPIPRPND